MTRQLGLHLCHNAALRQHLNLPKQDITFSKNRSFQIPIRNNTSVSKPYSLRLFTKLLLKRAATEHSAAVSLQKQELDPVYTSLVRDLKFWLLASCMSSSACFEFVTFSSVKKGFAVPISSWFKHSIAFCRMLSLQSFSLGAVGKGRGGEGGKRQQSCALHQDIPLRGM